MYTLLQASDEKELLQASDEKEQVGDADTAYLCQHID